MMDDGDRILVGVSGGKDSMALLWSLAERQRRSPVRYDLFPVYVDPGFEGGFAEALRAQCRDMGLDLRVAYTDFGLIAHSDENRENPCFLCARLRRKRLFEIAHELDCRKVALGHNKDDIIETFFMNICYAGEVSTMIPAQSFFNGLITVIRPLAFVEEDLIRRFVRQQGLSVFHNPCPSANRTKRQEIKELLRQLYRSNPKVKGNVFRAMHHVRLDYLL
ncbi:MAG: tRNA 2-thiocytidine biosynthesis TtcA family protein [Deltaproteobacteria bacterium]|nr:tRNA 2-thiocytidine biosynthesis TtcA family protein [Deltaproteobacteria bacterium]